MQRDKSMNLKQFIAEDGVIVFIDVDHFTNAVLSKCYGLCLLYVGVLFFSFKKSCCGFSNRFLYSQK